MSAPGHCRHCAADCSGSTRSPYGTVRWHMNESETAFWHVCPACDEAERIAAECDRLAKPCCDRHERIHGPQPDAYEHIADFARGDA